MVKDEEGVVERDHTVEMAAEEVGLTINLSVFL